MNKYEVNEGYNLNGIKSYDLVNGHVVVPEIFILKVSGGNIYYRDVLILDDQGVSQLTQTAIFIPDKD